MYICLKLHGILTKENLVLKKNWIWDVVEIDLTDVYVLQDHKKNKLTSNSSDTNIL